ncbi:segregation and condensation protein A [Roseiarcus sp.]|uniref:segregation and condensation protein A n=1 Tax=Roseiarcus sp. TaxID=1969460 RepID=UPI003F9A5420
MPAEAPFRSDFELDCATGEPAFTVDLDGFEGPLDLLLGLARRQKVDLARISVLALAEQYLLFVEAARKQRLELAADYLVMAAWLAYLKSRLLLPAPPQAAEPDAADLAEALAVRLRKLEAIRKAAGLLFNRTRLGRDVFGRGAPEAVEVARRSHWETNLYDLLAAYARQAQKHARARVRFKAREVWSLAEAREALARLIGMSFEWTAFDDWLLAACLDPGMRRSARASSFSASLELVREGKIEIRQEKTFAPIWIRPAATPPAEEQAA